MNKQTLHIAAGAACSTDSARPISVSRMRVLNELSGAIKEKKNDG